MSDLVHVRNTKTGRVGDVRRVVFESKVLNPDVLVEVDRDAKPYIPELYRPRDASSFLAEQARRRETPDPVAESDTLDPKEDE